MRKGWALVIMIAMIEMALAAENSCPLDRAKLGVCVDLQVASGDPVAEQCCPVIEGVVGVEAAVCLCTSIRSKLLNPDTVLPVALQLIAACGGNVGAGLQCPAQ